MIPDTPLDRQHGAALLVVALVVSGVAAGIGLGLVPTGDADDADPQNVLSFEERASELGFEYETSGPNTGNSDGAVLVTDYDRDGWRDVLAIGGDRPTLFENTGGEFERSGALPTDLNVTEVKSGLFFDYDNDGWDDLLLLPRTSGPVFLENDGGEFEKRDVGFDAPLSWGTSATAADYDGDGCLDVFITQNGNWKENIPQPPEGDDERDNGNPNLLYWGTCDGFERANNDTGIRGNHWSLVSSSVDLDRDGRQDIYVANDFYYDAVYLNRGNGTFARHEVPDSDRHGMAADVEDVNGDGVPDVFVTNAEYRNPETVWIMQSGLAVSNRGNQLLINQGNGTFEDVAAEMDVRVGGWGWSGNLADFDNDGQHDLVHTTQTFVRTSGGEDGSKAGYEYVRTYPNAWVRTGDNFTQVNASDIGLEPSNGRGLAVLDFDHDGDRDFVIADTSNPFKLYENTAGTGNYLSVAVAGQGTVTAGSEVTATVDGTERVSFLTSEVNYFSQNSRTEWFGLGDAGQVERLRVTFPDGTVVTAEDVSANQRVTVWHNGTVTTGHGG